MNYYQIILNHTYKTSPQNEWGIPGYIVAKTVNYTTKSAVTSKGPKFLTTLEDKRRITIPDSTKYSPTLENTQKTYWKPLNGKFSSAKKINFIEEQVNRNKSNPGPGAYQKDLKFGKTLGRFDKSERLSYLTTTESYAEEIPCSWIYETTQKHKVHSVKWFTPKPTKKVPKQEVGPGKYEVDLAKTLASSPRYSFPKSKTPDCNKRTKTPGVGTYTRAETGYFNCVAKKIRATVIMPYKIKGFTETVTKNAAGLPGPGSYNIGPPVLK